MYSASSITSFGSSVRRRTPSRPLSSTCRFEMSLNAARLATSSTERASHIWKIRIPYLKNDARIRRSGSDPADERSALPCDEESCARVT